MDADAGGPQTKRLRYNLDGEEIPFRGRGQVTGLNKYQKIKTHQFVWTLYKRTCEELGYAVVSPVDWILDSLVMNLVYSLHQAMRQGQGQKASAFTRFYQVATHTVQAHGQTFSVSTQNLVAICTALQTELGFLDATRHEWAGNVQTMISLWLLFYEHLKETRITPTHLTIGKDTEGNTTKIKSIALSDLGVLSQFRQLCAGLNYRPFMRGALAQTIGPIAQLLLLIHSQGMYTNKWKAAVRPTFAYVPHIDQIVEFLGNAQHRNCVEIVAQFCNIAMIAGGREQRRISPPPYHLFLAMGKYKTVKRDGQDVTEFVFDPDFAEAIDFSGMGAYRAYKKIVDLPRSRVTVNIGNAHITQQLLFHATFGTYVEDFGVLSFVTRQTGWNSRRDMDPHFKTMKAAAPKLAGAAAVRLFNLAFYAKMAGSTLVQGAAQTTQVTNANPQFSGFRTRIFTPEMEEQAQRQSGAGAFISSEDGIRATLRATHNHLNSLIQGKRTFEAGTVKWRQFDGITVAGAQGPEVDDVPQETGRLYWTT